MTAGSTNDSSIVFEALTKRYGARTVLDGFDVGVRPGSVTALLGPNGSGKTTALRVLLGLERATSGRALIGGREYRKLDHPVQRIGALLDASWVHPRRSAGDHLAWIARASGIVTDNVTRALAEVGLSGVADQSAGTFSLGMRQRLGIAATILGDPRVLVFDEPLNGLDQEGVHWVRDFFARQTEQGRTVLLSTHMLQEVEHTADRIIVLGQGTVLYEGPTDGLESGESAVEIGVREHPDADELVHRLAADHGWRVEPLPAGTGGPGYLLRGAQVEQVTTALADTPLILRRVQESGSLEQAYGRLTATRADYIGR